MKITIGRSLVIPVLMLGGFLVSGSARAGRAVTPPAGSYLLTCNHEWMAGTSLVAQCATEKVVGVMPTRMAYPSATTLQNVYECVGDISNNHGKLECNRGSFRQSCTGVLVSPVTCSGVHTVTAECKKKDGTQASATLSANLWACNDVVNDDGMLMCK
jgi:hypothetical protein